MSGQSDQNVALTLGPLGFVAYAVTSVAATQLDGAISLIDAGTAFLAIGLARIAAAHDTGVHPTADPRSAAHHLTRGAGRALLH